MPNNNEVTNRELLQIITTRMDQGFSEVIKRQDTTNGRVRDGEILSAQYGIRLKNLERELFASGGRRVGRRNVDPVVRPAVPERRVTERDVRIVLTTLASAGSVLFFFWKILPFALKALNP